MASYPSPQDAEDAFYDAIDEKDVGKMLGVWEDSDAIACLLPMQPLIRGRQELSRMWQGLLGKGMAPDLAVTHLAWVETGEIAVHLVEEQIRSPEGRPLPPMYATNVYRQGPDGWRLLLHQNSPSPPPPGAAASPGMR